MLFFTDCVHQDFIVDTESFSVPSCHLHFAKHIFKFEKCQFHQNLVRFQHLQEFIDAEPKP